MRWSSISLLLYLGASLVTGASVPNVRDVAIRNLETDTELLNARSEVDLEKRKGGGGGGGGKGGSGGSSSSKGGSGGSSSSSNGGSGSGSSSSGSKSGSGSSSSSKYSSYSFSTHSNTGGRTRSGSGVQPSYFSNRYYAGGSSVPYTSGARSPGGLSPSLYSRPNTLFLFPGVWAYGAYGYGFHHPYYYHNRTNNNSNTTNSSIPITCLCQQYAECGCEDTGSANNTVWVAQMMNVSEGAFPQNSSLVKYVDFGNGTTELYLNGTLDNGTTASGGTEPSSESEVSGAQAIAQFSGYWLMFATVVATITMT
ncbi:putative conserved glycine-rich protein [Phaeomoniella chlamydospora]|uniref:Putative conserved glycine-rich protein n=1 Tax=Phaeomoniella chlamydospora TaxID=158046 RepID=A0A0G2GU69_PHACM|nr:putative conserved glycine-rich protein [Phaeomoniella chlamydospora]